MASILFLALSGCFVTHVDTSTEDFVEEAPFDAVVIELDAGSVEVLGDPEAIGAVGTVVTSWGGRVPEVEHYVDEGVLHVVGRCEPLQIVCTVDLELVVPTGVAVTVETGSGDVLVEELTGDVDARTGSGDVDLARLAGHVEVDTGSGDVSLCDVSGNVVAETGSGDVQATGSTSRMFDATTGSGSVIVEMAGDFDRLDAETGSGDVLLTVPAGDYDLQLDTGSGDVDVDPSVKEDPGADSCISAYTGSGDVTILGW